LRIRTNHIPRQLDIASGNKRTNATLQIISHKRSRLFRTLCLSQILRKYSALTLVILSVFFVATHNIINRYEQRFSFSSKHPSFQEQKHGIETMSMYNTIALLPHISFATLTDSDRKEEEVIAESYEIIAQANTSSPLSFLSTQSFIASAHAMEKDPEINGGVTLYIVQEGDTASSIAQKHNITLNTLYWANNIEDIDEIMPGDTLFILPVAGLKHTAKENESLEDIAKKYEVSEEQIIAFNELPANGEIKVGAEIIIPGAEKDIPQPEPEESFFAPRQYAGSSGKTVENRHGKPNRFPYGYCTWYVAQQKYIPWRGNAGAWLYNAKAVGYATGSKAKEGAIVVTTDNTYYGHVALVTKVTSDTITVTEMNYDAWGKVNTRTINKNDRKIRGYIY
jgi:surface antigen